MQGHRQIHKTHLQGASNVVGGGLRIALVGNVCDLGAGFERQQFARQMARAASARRAEVEFAGLFFGQIHQLFEGVDSQAWMHCDHVGDLSHFDDGRQVFAWAKRHARVQSRVDRHGDAVDQQGVAIGRRLGHKVAANIGACTGFVFDEHWLAHGVLQLLCDGAGKHVG